MSRTFKVRGADFLGVEIARQGDQVTLRGHGSGWPFPQEKTFSRWELVFMHGDPEPSPEPKREFPEEPQAPDTTGDLFGEDEGGKKP